MFFFSSLHTLTPVLPLYAVSLGADTSAVGWLVGAFSVTALLARPYVTNASERIGRRPMYLAGALIFTVAPLSYIVARSIPLLLAARALHGLGITLFLVSAWALVADLIPPSRRGEGMGYYSLTFLVGMAVAPPIAVPLLPLVGFEGIFVGASVLAAVSLALSLMVPERKRERAYARLPSFLALARYRWLLIPTIALIGGALTLGVIQSFLPLYIAERDAGNVGVFFSIYAVATLVSRALIGPLSDRVGRIQVLIPAQMLVAVTMVLLGRIESERDLMVVAVLYAVSFGTLLPIVTAIVVDRAPDDVRGAALSVATASFDLGIGLGAVGLGWVGAVFGYARMYELTGLFTLAGAALLVWDQRTRSSGRVDGYAER